MPWYSQQGVKFPSRRMPWRRLCCGVVGGFCAFAALADGTAGINYDATIRAAREDVATFLRKEGIEGASVAVTDEHGLLWLEGFGYSDKKRNIRAYGETVYGAGTISMIVTALAIMREVDKKTIELDTPLAHYLPEFTIHQHQTASKPLTLRNLLSHHSGLPYNIYKGMWSTAPPASLEKTIAALNSEYAAYAPEKLMTLSLINYVLAGRVLEKVTGHAFSLAAQQRVLQPLGMADSNFQLTSALQARLAEGYKNGAAQPLLQARDTPALGLYTSAKDIATLLRMLLNEGRVDGNEVWSAGAINETLRPQFANVALDLGTRYGMGWSLGDIELNGAGGVAWRQGATLTHRGRVILLPEAHLAVVVFANSSKAYKFTEQIATQIARRFVERKLGRPLPTQDSSPPALAPPMAVLGARSGAYATRVGYVNLAAEGDRLQGNVMGWQFQLQPHADGWFYPRLRLFGFVPIDLELLEAMKVAWQRLENQDIMISQFRGQNAVFAERLAQQALTPAWKARLGRYVIDNPDELTDFMDVKGGELRYDQGVLYLGYKLPLWIPLTFRVPLRIINDQEAVIAGLGTGLGETIRVVKSGSSERIYYSGYLIRLAK